MYEKLIVTRSAQAVKLRVKRGNNSYIFCVCSTGTDIDEGSMASVVFDYKEH
ncbi:MAG: hypothetical protein H6773_00340 [Pseudomonadales bacterium]|nr:hypothetical protein [Pseudomonadales bacterium]